MKIIVLIMVSIVLNFFTYAEDGKVIYNKYKKIIEDNRNESPMENKGRDFLLQLSKDDFSAFIRELPKSIPGYDEKNIDNVWAMVIFAQIYIEGTGKNESLKDTLKQLSDPTLPTSWKMGLLDVLQLPTRPNLSESEINIILNMFSENIKNKQELEFFRDSCLTKLGLFIFFHKRCLEKKYPEFKNALEKQDKSLLPKKDDDNIKEIKIIIDAIAEYKVILSMAIKEFKTESYKTRIRKRLEKWNESSQKTDINSKDLPENRPGIPPPNNQTPK